MVIADPHPERRVPCPFCGVQAHQPCRNVDPSDSHWSRYSVVAHPDLHLEVQSVIKGEKQSVRRPE
jgi:hypothetical protein